MAFILLNKQTKYVSLFLFMTLSVAVYLYLGLNLSYNISDVRTAFGKEDNNSPLHDEMGKSLNVYIHRYIIILPLEIQNMCVCVYSS